MRVLLFLFAIAGVSLSPAAPQKPVPVTYIMVCCHAVDKGTKFLARGGWDTKHDYRDYGFARDQMAKIKAAGIRVVGVDFSMPF